MDFIENFGNRNNMSNDNHGYHHHNDEYYGSHHYRISRKRELLFSIAEKIKTSRKLKILVLLILLIIITIVAGLIILLIPVISSIFDYLMHNGIQGIIEKVNSIINTILKGSSN